MRNDLKNMRELWPNMWFGDTPASDADITDFEDFDPDDELLPVTPPDVVAILGFDPLELPDE